MNYVAWFFWRMFHPGCVLCQPRVGTFTFADLCSSHRRRQEDALAENARIHPQGRCTTVCGCLSLEQFEAGLGLPE